MSTSFALELAYEGTDFAGWQLQPDAPTVQGCVESALATVHGDEGGRIPVVGAGRTDTGVHALGQVAGYRQPNPRSAGVLRAALDKLLPPSVRVIRLGPMPADFHACKSATGKIYRYRIVNRALMLPFERHYAWQVRIPLDLAAMRKAARLLEGKHDFAAFATGGGQSKTTVRTLRRLSIRDAGGGVVEIEAEADGFLYRMVRNLTGLLVEIGMGKREPAEVSRILASLERAEAGLTAPAHGLCLVRVFYPERFRF